MYHCYSTSPNRLRIKCTISHSKIHILLHFCIATSYIKLLWKAEDTCFTWLTYFGNPPLYYIITSCASRWSAVIVCWSFSWISEKVLWEYISSFTVPHDWFGVCCNPSVQNNTWCGNNEGREPYTTMRLWCKTRQNATSISRDNTKFALSV